MKKITLVAILLALTISAGVNQISARPAVQTGNELLQVLPDGTGVFVVNVGKITSSSLWNLIASQNKIKSGLDKASNELSDIGVKLSDLQTVAVVFSTNMNKPVIAVTGGLEQS